MYCEDEAIKQGRLEENQRLSSPMRQSWESGDFWIAYAARNNFAFDAIYWEKIDQRFFGSTACPSEDAWKQSVDLLVPAGMDEMERYVTLKGEDMKSQVPGMGPERVYLGPHRDHEDEHCDGSREY